jgi:hypothetical protein
MNREEQKQLGVAKVRFLRPLLGLRVWDKHSNVDIRNKLNQDSILDGIGSYQQYWIQHVYRTENNRSGNLTLQFQHNGKRDIGFPRRRWREQFYLKTNELYRTGLTALNLERFL